MWSSPAGTYDIAKLHQVKKVQMYMYLKVKSKFSNLYTFQKITKTLSKRVIMKIIQLFFPNYDYVIVQ